MPESKRRNVLIGLTVLGGLIALAILIVKFGESQAWFGNRYILYAKFDRVVGVREGTEVRMSGVWIGSVSKVDLLHHDHPNEGVVVQMQISRDFTVPQGSRAEILLPLMGQPVINIMPPAVATAALPRDGTAMIYGTVVNPLQNIIEPHFMATMEKTTQQLGDLAEALKPAANAITDLLQKRPIEEVESPQGRAQHLSANLYTAVERLHNVLLHIDQIIGDPATQSNLKTTIDNLRLASEDAKAAVAGFRQFSNEARETAASARVVVGKMDATVDKTQQRIDELATRLTENSDRLARVLDSLVSASGDLAEGKGTVGLLLRDPRFYEELVLTMQRMSQAAADLQTTVAQWKAGGLPVKLR